MTTMPRLLKAGIIFQAHKLPVFSRHLVAAGYHYEQSDGPGKGMHTLTVMFNPAEQRELTKIIIAATAEANK